MADLPSYPQSWLPTRPLALPEGPEDLDTLMGIGGLGSPSGNPMKSNPQFRGRVYHVAAWRGMDDKRRLKMLAKMAREYGTDPRLRIFVANKVLVPAGVEPRNYRGQAAAMLRWVQENIYYTNEPGEQIQSPWWTLKVRTGDCDDLSVLLAAMAHSIGLHWRFVLAGRDPSTGERVRWTPGQRKPRGVRFYHIYLDLGWPPLIKPNSWAAAEPTIKNVPLGYDVVNRGVPGEVSLPELSGPDLGEEADQDQDQPLQPSEIIPARRARRRTGPQYIGAVPEVPEAETISAEAAQTEIAELLSPARALISKIGAQLSPWKIGIAVI